MSSGKLHAFIDLGSFNKFRNMSYDERVRYVDGIFGSSDVHKILAKIRNFTANFLSVEALYFLSDSGSIKKFRITSDFPLSIINAFRRDNDTLDIKDFCEREKGLSEGDIVVCAFDMESGSDFIKSKRYFKILLSSINKDVHSLEDFYENNHILFKREYWNESVDTEDWLPNVYHDIDATIQSKLSDLESAQNELDTAKAELTKLREANKQLDEEIESRRQQCLTKLKRDEVSLQNTVNQLESRLLAFGVSQEFINSIATPLIHLKTTYNPKRTLLYLIK